MNWTEAEHHSNRDAVSFSLLSKFGKVTEDGSELNPGRFLAAWQSKFAEGKKSRALEFGTLAHLAVYEPDRLLTECVARPVKDDGKTIHSTTSKVFKEFAAQNVGKRLLHPVDLAVTLGLVAAVKASPAVRRLHDRPSLYREQSIVADSDALDTPAGLGLRIRIDQVLEGDHGWIVEDLKTTEDASPAAFKKSCWKFRYFERMAFYLDVAEAYTGVRARGAFIAVTKSEPYQVAVYEPRKADIDEGRAMYRASLLELARCFREDDWRAPWEKAPVML